MKNTTIILAAALLLLPACGKKGPLVLEPEKLPPPVSGLGFRQVGHEIELSWKYPALLSDGKPRCSPPRCAAWPSTTWPSPSAPRPSRKKASSWPGSRPPSCPAAPTVFLPCAVPFKAKLLKDKEHAFALSYQYGRSRSALSAVEKITTRTPPAPVRDLKLGREGKVVILSWSRPQADSEGQPLPALAGYRVYRRILQGERSRGFRAPSTPRP